MYLIFDTETTGLPDNWNAPLTDSDNWPRMVQLAWSVVDATGKIIRQKESIIKPTNFRIPPNMIHGISQSTAEKKGNDIELVLIDFLNDFDSIETIIAHNFDFDFSIVGAEIIRLQKPIGLDFLNKRKANFCTMKDSRIINFCKLPPIKYNSYKRPKLNELYYKLFGRTFHKAHDALSDMNATKESFFELKRRSII